MEELSYKKIERLLKYRILSGEYLPGNRLSSVRTIAEELGYNPATVCHALSCLQQQGLVRSQTTVGYFITNDVENIRALRMKEGKMLTNDLYGSLYTLGYSKSEMIECINFNF